jgi:spermidine synthase
MTMPNLNVIVEDGRYALNQLDATYTMIGIDAYRVPYVPWHLTTVEFFEEVRDHLAEDGVLIINVGRTSTDRRLIEGMTRTLLEVFPTVHTMDVPDSYNTILVATRQPTDPNHLRANALALSQRSDVSPVLQEALLVGVSALRPTEASEMVFTDDHAPVEMIVDAMVIEFLLTGGLDELE